MDDMLRHQRPMVMANIITGATGVAATAIPSRSVEASRAAASIGLQCAHHWTGDAARATATRATMSHLLRATIRIGAIGLAVDATVGAVKGLLAYQRGEMTGEQACAHAAVEAGTRVVSTSAGVLLAACAVALTGGLAAPVLLTIGKGGAAATRLGLRRLLDARSSRSPQGASAAVATPDLRVVNDG
ncbi:hypothetical protein OV090_30985 [Nannocystis sp. RBIL2]|uniref:hypothetical protein n=1 Tax=Nannocystis sp. RBIL2 TaxID=2996788 RepID=UPI0022716A36|nr:hypothetical protein [Nannocystis sp. RBIL2]MCY1069206.1 hypothetical protein [Nannocystis sp. RBIL2]